MRARGLEGCEGPRGEGTLKPAGAGARRVARAEVEERLRAGARAEEVAAELREILEELQKGLRGILGSVIVTDAGSPLVWELRGGVEPMVVATAGAVLARAGERGADVLDLGRTRSTVLTTEQGSLVVFRVVPGVSLVVLLQPTANSVLVLVEVGKALERLRGVIAHGP